MATEQTSASAPRRESTFLVLTATTGAAQINPAAVSDPDAAVVSPIEAVTKSVRSDSQSSQTSASSTGTRFLPLGHTLPEE